jgi:hypothetical protein
MNKSWITNPRGQNDSYKKDKKKDLQKESGGGAATSGSFGGGAGTVFTSQDSGVFTPSYSGRSERKKRWDKNRKGKKRSGVERLGLFITDQSPERKMQKALKSSTVKLIKWVQTELKKDNVKFRQQSSSTAMNDQTKQTDGLRNPVFFDAEPDKEADVAQKDVEDKIRSIDDSDTVKNNKPYDKGDEGLSVQLSYGSGTETGPTVTGGYRDLDGGHIDAEDEDDKDSPFV